MPGLAPDLPVLRDSDACSYFKEDAGKLLVGWFEPHAKPWGDDGIPENFAFDQLPADLAHIEPLFAGCHAPRAGAGAAGIQKFFNGPESFTPDVRYLLGEIAGAARPVRRGRLQFHRHPVRRRRGQGARRLDRRRPSADRICGTSTSAAACRSSATASYLRDAHRRRASGCCTPCTGRSASTRPRAACASRRCTTVSRAAGACFGEVAGWERANWFAAAGTPAATSTATAARTGSSTPPPSTARCASAVGLFDQSSFAKFRARGRATRAHVSKRICANDVDVRAGPRSSTRSG